MGKTTDSFDHLRRKIDALSRSGPQILDPGLRMIGEEIMTDVKASRPGRGVPRDEGTLANSGIVEGPVNHVVTLSFGGAAEKYALVQHERLDFHHTLGEARYLVRGVERWRPNQGAALATLQLEAIKAVMEARKVP